MASIVDSYPVLIAALDPCFQDLVREIDNDAARRFKHFADLMQAEADKRKQNA
jgi:hypothetical protein